MLISSILIYILIAVLMWLLASNAEKSKLSGQYSNAKISLLIALLLFTILSGFRYRVGVDCEEYAESYMLLRDGMSISNSGSLENSEIGFLLISKFMAFLQLPRFVYMGFWAFLEIGLITLAMKGRRDLLPYIYLVLILGPYYLSFMNGIRQSVVSCAFVLAIKGLVDNKEWKKYIVILLLSCLIHKSAILLLPLVFIVYYNRRPKVLMCLFILLACTVLGRTPFVKEHAQLATWFLEISGYSNYADKIEYYVDLDATVTSFGPRRLVQFLSGVFVILFAGNVDRRFKYDRLYRVSFLFSVIYACLSELSISLDILFTRPLLYFLPFMLICQGYTLKYLSSPDRILKFRFFRLKMNVAMATAFFMGVLIIFCSYCILNNIAERNLAGEATLFKFYFFQ